MEIGFGHVRFCVSGCAHTVISQPWQEWNCNLPHQRAQDPTPWEKEGALFSSVQPVGKKISLFLCISETNIANLCLLL